MSSSAATLVIAEAGVNHNGSREKACELIWKAAEARADLVKFQAFRTHELVTAAAPKAAYQEETTGRTEGQREMIARLELGEEDFLILQAEAARAGIGFLVSPFDRHSLTMLKERLGLTRIKLGSGEITHGPLLYQAGHLGLEVILSTGMATLGEIEQALILLGAGYAAEEGERVPDTRWTTREWEGRPGQLLREKVTLLHCTTEYPCPADEVNLRAMDTLREAFGLPVGFSDHTEGLAVCWAAVARGATVVEKHFTLDRNLPGPDHRASLEPPALAELVAGIRAIEQAMGCGHKVPTPRERANLPIVRRSLVAARPIAKGELFTPENLTCKRPGTGTSPFQYWDYLGRRAGQNYQTDDLVAE